MSNRELQDAVDIERLGEELRAACRDVESSLAGLVESAIRAGGILTEIRQYVPRGEWMLWLNANFPFNAGTAHKWIRLHHYRAHVLPATSMNKALLSVSGLPRVDPFHVGFDRNHPDWMRAEAKSLKKSGRSYTAIAKSLGVHHATVQSWVNDAAYRQRQAASIQARRAGARALKAEQALAADQALAAAAEPGLSSAYSTIRLHLEALDRAILEASDDEGRRLLRAARNNAQRAEQRIVRVLGIS